MRLLLAFVVVLYGVAFLWGVDKREVTQLPGPATGLANSQPFSAAQVPSQDYVLPSPPAALRALQLTIDPSRDDNRTITVSAPGTLVLELQAQSGTGFQWDVVSALPAFLIFQGMRVSDRPEPAPGASKPQLLTFNVVSAGETTVQLAYRQPWNAAKSEVRRLRLKLIAQ